MTDWQPIETAPKGWESIILHCPSFYSSNDGGVMVGYYDDIIKDWWGLPDGGLREPVNPTHWMPLPPPPT